MIRRFVAAYDNFFRCARQPRQLSRVEKWKSRTANRKGGVFRTDFIILYLFFARCIKPVT